MLIVKISYEYNYNEIEITMTEPVSGGKPSVEDAVRKLTDKAKERFIAALNA